MVDGHDLSEVLQHHQHVIHPYRFMILRAQDNARAKFASERNRAKTPPRAALNRRIGTSAYDSPFTRLQ